MTNLFFHHMYHKKILMLFALLSTSVLPAASSYEEKRTRRSLKYFPFLNQDMPESNITTACNQEAQRWLPSNKYFACRFLEDFLKDSHDPEKQPQPSGISDWLDALRAEGRGRRNEELVTKKIEVILDEPMDEDKKQAFDLFREATHTNQKKAQNIK